MGTRLDQLCINTIRTLAMDAVQKANSGHPGLPMGMADVAYVLWTGFLRHNPANPDWPNRDRFLLSAGHGSMLLYGLLHLTGYDLPLEELENFRRWDILSMVSPPASKPRPVLWGRASPMGWGWRLPNVSWRPLLTGLVFPSSTTTPTPSSPTAN